VRTEQEKQAVEALQRLANETQEYTRQFGTDDNEDYSDDEEDDEEYSDNEEDTEDDHNLNGGCFTPGKKRQTTKPPKDSTLEKHFTNLKNGIYASGDLANGHQWFPPDYDPLSKDTGPPDPADWYNSKMLGVCI